MHHATTTRRDQSTNPCTPTCTTHPWNAPASIAARKLILGALLAAFPVATLERVLGRVLGFLRTMVDLTDRAEGCTNAADQDALSVEHDAMEALYLPGDEVLADAIIAAVLGSTAPHIVDTFDEAPYVSEYSEAAIDLVSDALARARAGGASEARGTPDHPRATVADVMADVMADAASLALEEHTTVVPTPATAHYLSYALSVALVEGRDGSGAAFAFDSVADACAAVARRRLDARHAGADAVDLDMAVFALAVAHNALTLYRDHKVATKVG